MTLRGDLRCGGCGQTAPPAVPVWRCPTCTGPLTWHGPAAISAADIQRQHPGLWRYTAVLPVDHDASRGLGETMTPIVEGRIDGVPTHFKLDYLLPTGSFKDRGAAVLIGGLAALGVRRIVEDSSGNAAAAVAGYSARAGLACTIYAPASASAGKLVQVRAFGATLVRVPGPRSATSDAVVAAAEQGDAFYASHNWHPWFIEGVKTWALEVWEQLGRLPRAVVVPVGSGSMLLGAYRGFQALLAGGVPGQMPRLFAAQPAACAPLAQAWQAGQAHVMPVAAQPTLAEGASIAAPVRGTELLAVLRASDGGAVSVDETTLVAGLKSAWHQGLYIEPTSALAVAAASQLRRNGTLGARDEVVVLLSGSGLKSTERNAALLDEAAV